ncbi:bifunctional Calcium-activated potassium channel BK [Babesia duncani]|uniref:Bifunctional Calcium-activated potassium channel BK n=1 Tax=Babesia duncani TaxID=323732 RepID=A0AAD9UQR3_9APIC|nr:bifunctional Calcium-activated potassium channel BK [Babesia duncani]
MQISTHKSRLASKARIKSTVDIILVSIILSCLLVTVITASSEDTIWQELIPPICGFLGFIFTLYIVEFLRNCVITLRTTILIKRKQLARPLTFGPDETRNDVSPQSKSHLRSGSAIYTFTDRVSLWYKYLRLSLICMVQQSCMIVVLWDIIRLILWLCTLTYWRRDNIEDSWDFSKAPLILYQLHFLFMGASSAETFIYVLGSDDLKDVLFSTKFWATSLIMPPFTLVMKYTLLTDMSFFDIYWLLGFIIWIKLFKRKSFGIWRTVVGILLMAFGFAGCMYVLQGIHPHKTTSNPYFHAMYQYSEFFYFAFITFSTVGYGDIRPMTARARLISILFVSWMLIWVPLEVNNIIKIVSGKSEIVGYLSTWASCERFILLIGEVDPVQLSMFITKVYYSEERLKIVMVTSRETEEYSTQVDQAKLLGVTLCILNGEIGPDGNIKLLKIVKANHAHLIFLLSSFKSKDIRKMDMKTATRAISLKKNGNVGENVIVQFCSSLGPQISLQSFGNLVSLYRVKTAMIAKNITCPGIITLIINLSLHYNSYVPRNYGSESNTLPKGLYNHYLRGAAKRLYVHAIPEKYTGITFDLFCENLFKFSGMIALGIVGSEDNRKTYRINPLGENYIIADGDKAILIAGPTDSSDMHNDANSSDRNSSLFMQNPMFSIMLKNGLMTIKNQTSNVLQELQSFPTIEGEDHYANEDISMELTQHMQSTFPCPKSPEHNSMVVNSISDAVSGVFHNSLHPIIAIIGYSESVLPLLAYFEELGSFNVVIFGRQISVSININLFQRFKGFLALIDGDPMRRADVNRAELERACYFYVVPCSNPNDPEIESDQDLRTIVIYRHLKNTLRNTLNEKCSENSIFGNIFALVELHNSSNATYLDDSTWTSWNVFDEKLDLTMSYIQSHEYAMGQFISNEMFYSLTINSTLLDTNQAIYRILLDLTSIGDPSKKCQGVELITTADLCMNERRPTFAAAFNHLLKTQNAILIGIYRMGVNAMENCVICSPGPEFVIRNSDMAYIIRNENGVTIL